MGCSGAPPCHPSLVVNRGVGSIGAASRHWARANRVSPFVAAMSASTRRLVRRSG